MYAEIAQQLDVSLLDAVRMVSAFGSERKGKEEAAAFRYAKVDYGFMREEETRKTLIDLLIKGNSWESALNAYVVSRALGIEAIEALERYREGSEEYERHEEEIWKEREELGLLDAGAALADSGEEEEYREYLEGPFNLERNAVESVDTRKGTLEYTDSIVRIPGRNGLDININMSYSSGEYYDSETKEGLYGTGWNMGGFTRLGREDRGSWRSEEPNYVVFADGSKYDFHCRASGDRRWIELRGYNFKDVSAYYDETGVVRNAVYKLLYKEKGRIEYFDEKGRILKVEDNYGNKITFDYSAEEGRGTTKERTLITGTRGEQVEITAVTTGTGRTETYKLPLNRQITYTYEKKSESKTWILTGKTDEEGMTTTYEYEYLGTGKTANGVSAFLTRIKFPTGDRKSVV